MNKTAGLRIMKCDDSQLWYSDKVGCIVPFLGKDELEDLYWSREDGGYINWVKIGDCQIIETMERAA